MLLVVTLTVASIVGQLSETPDRTPRPLYEINRDISALIKRDSSAQSESDRAAAAYDMATLYREILVDPRLSTSPKLKEYRGRLWSRLTRIKKDVLAKIRRESKGGDTDEDSVNAVSLSSLAVADNLSLVGATLGGPAAIYSSLEARGGGMAPPDFGPDLVDLIQRTIQPDFWDVNGGPGTIVYYRPLHCLVVRATSDVHHQLGGGIDAIRRAGQ